MNAAPMNKAQYEKYLQVIHDPRFQTLKPLFYDEYRALLCAIKNKPDSQDGW